MSINMDSMTEHGDTDYSDYEYQHLDFEHVELGDSNSERGIATASVEPLESRGGLETHQVAELVTQFTTVYVEPDNFGGVFETGNSAPGNFEFRGVFGSDLDSSTDLISDQADGGRNTLVSGTGSTELFSEDGAQPQVIVRGHDKTEVFDHFAAIGTMGFEDETSGAGGGAMAQNYSYKKDYRDDMGRGPILDSTDEIGIVSQLVKNNLTADGLSGHYRTTLVWDTAEVEDAGRKFGVPSR